MSRKINHRATQLRSQQAANARRRQEKDKRSAFWAAHGRKIRLAVILVIVAAALYAAYQLGSMLYRALNQPAELTDLSAIEESWIVIDTDPGKDKRYHHPATFDIPEGYANADYMKFRNNVQQAIQALPADDAAPVASIYVDAVANKSARTYLDETMDKLNRQQAQPPLQLEGPLASTIAGKPARCVYARCSAADGQEFSALYVAFDAPGGVCVFAILTSDECASGQAPDCQTLLSEAEVLLAGLTIVQ